MPVGTAAARSDPQPLRLRDTPEGPSTAARARLEPPAGGSRKRGRFWQRRDRGGVAAGRAVGRVYNPDCGTAGAVLLRAFADDDVSMVLDLSRDPYVPLIGTLPAQATATQAHDWIQRNLGRWDEGAGFSFAVADAATGRALGAAGLWLAKQAHGRARAGYSIAPRERGSGYAGDALTALTTFAWTLPDVHRVELYIEPWNIASLRTAERAGYTREGLLRSHQEIGGRRRDMLLYASLRTASTACPDPRRPGPATIGR